MRNNSNIDRENRICGDKSLCFCTFPYMSSEFRTNFKSYSARASGQFTYFSIIIVGITELKCVELTDRKRNEGLVGK